MKRLVVLVALVALVAITASTALGRNARPDAAGEKHGFTCVSGHLRKTPRLEPRAPVPTPSPVPPYSPPTGPVGTADTTVTVGLFDASNGQGWILLSQTTIPSGTVTFVITNNCMGACSFDLQGVKAGAILHDTGQSETWTVALAPGTYLYHCDVDPFGMKGSFAVTP